MIRYNRRDRLLAAGLSALAGFVDAIGFLALAGFFVSFMSGNSTRLAIGLAEGTGEALTAGLLIAGFVAGVVLGSVVGHVAGSGRRRTIVLVLVAVLLALAAILALAGNLPLWLVIAPVVLAMGAENTVFQRDGEVSVGLTYMTGNLVKLGQRIAAALLGGDRWGWWPYLVLWLGLVTGAVLGAIAFDRLALQSLWLAAAAATALAGSAWALDRTKSRPA